ncbi:hypothetical protein Dimus_010679, partial [Dionaea muscipula]
MRRVKEGKEETWVRLPQREVIGKDFFLLPSSLLTEDVLFSAVRTEEQRCRKIDKLKEEKYALKREIKELRFECDSTFEISSQMKADIDMIIGENQMLERKNKELENKYEEMKSALEREKKRREEAEEKVKKMDSRLQSSRKVKEILDKELRVKTQKNKELKAELNTARLSLSQ